MATLDELRTYVLSLPDTSEGTHFRNQAFFVQKKTFAFLIAAMLRVSGVIREICGTVGEKFVKKGSIL